MSRERRAAAIAAALALCAILGAAGCVGAPTADPGRADPAATGEAGGGREVLMLGRSVMGGWFQHWGYDGTNPVEKNGYRLRYREIEGPDGIARSASDAIGEAAPGSVVFFKFCFVDFSGSDKAGADAELERNKRYVETVVAAAEAGGVTLIVGNALPNVASQTNSYLVGEHRAYNAWLETVASQHPDNVRVFDQYSVLADAGGALKPEYASAPDDAHPNEAAYTALDEAFFAFMEAGP